MRTTPVGCPDAVCFFGSLAPAYPDTTAQTRRRGGRVEFQVPVRVYDQTGEVEFAETGDVSSGGFRFRSQREYAVGHRLLVEILCGETGQCIQARAKIVRLAPSPEGKVYGVCYVA